MSGNINATAKKSVCFVCAIAAAVGIMTLSAVAASGAAVGSVSEGFRMAGKKLISTYNRLT